MPAAKAVGLQKTQERYLPAIQHIFQELAMLQKLSLTFGGNTEECGVTMREILP